MFKPFIIITLICSLAFSDDAQNKTVSNDSQLKQFPIISDDVVYLPSANRYIYSTDKLLTNNHQYKPQAIPILNKIVPLAMKARVVNIYGFTNESLKGPIGIKTSGEQAQMIADYLWSQGIQLEKMNIRGMGYQEPRINSSNDVEQHFFNRRIEIDLIP
ncbi:MAG: hypothetical protein VX835_05165 [Pseudomonadota bacterium]|nr:hypothetical protein [Pseudomonadota bacterium]